jgi:hypothetical protein
MEGKDGYGDDRKKRFNFYNNNNFYYYYYYYYFKTSFSGFSFGTKDLKTKTLDKYWQ